MTQELNTTSVDDLPKGSMISIYTDGACRNNPGPAAWAFVIVFAGAVIIQASASLGRATNNVAEMTAALEALALIQARPDLLVTVFSDSQLVIRGMLEWMPGWKRRGWRKADQKPPENLSLWQALDNASAGLPKVSWQWVKGHAGDRFNAMADDLASTAARQ